MKALLVDDDEELVALMREFFARHQVDLRACTTGAEGLRALAQHAPDVILLDLMLPDMDGFAVATRIREAHATPIIMLTARGEDTDKIVGLELGADDYVAKPCNPRELLARMRAVTRRNQGGAARTALVVGPLDLERTSREALLNGVRVELTSQEFDLLWALASHAGTVLSRDQLLDLVKGPSADEAFDRSVDVQMSRLRAKLEEDPRRPRMLKTVRGAGYMMARTRP